MKEVFPYGCDRCGSQVRFGAEVEDMDHQTELVVGCRCESVPISELPGGMYPGWILDMDYSLDEPGQRM